MSDDNVLDQSEIERLLGGGGGASAPAPPPASAPDNGGILDQSELDALFASGAAAAATPSATPAAAPETAGPLDQSDIEALFGGGAPKAAPAAPKSPPAFTPPPRPSAAPTTPPPFAAAQPPFGGGMGSGMGNNMGSPGGGYDDMDGEEEDEDGVPRGDIDYLLKRADDSLRSISAEKLDLPTEVIEFQFPEFGGTVPSTEHATLDQISEVELDVKIELGRTNMYLEDVLKLRKGSIVPLDKMAGDAIDIYINGRLLARGEVLVMNENFCIRVAELLAGAIPME